MEPQTYNWWDTKWFFLIIGWIGGIPTGLVVNWLWKIIQQRRKEDYLHVYTSVSQDSLTFEGKVSGQYDIKTALNSIIKNNDNPN